MNNSEQFIIMNSFQLIMANRFELEFIPYEFVASTWPQSFKWWHMFSKQQSNMTKVVKKTTDYHYSVTCYVKSPVQKHQSSIIMAPYFLFLFFIELKNETLQSISSIPCSILTQIQDLTGIKIKSIINHNTKQIQAIKRTK